MYRPYNRFDFYWFLFRILNKTAPHAIKYVLYKELKHHIHNAEAVLALGGDNYSIDFGIPRHCTDLDDMVLARCKPMVIWGASVGPFDSNPEYEKYMIGHLRNIHIFARESLTIDYLASIGLTEKVYRVADPAFLMEPEQPIDMGKPLEIEPGSIGLNLNPVMAKAVTNGDMGQWCGMCAEVLRAVMQKVRCKIYLIPHVFASANNNDFLFMKDVLRRVPEAGDKIILIPPVYNAAQLKWILGQMSIFAGGRTHATIGSLSSCVPTLSFAYSMKAKGINKDIFGHRNYCISGKDFSPENVLSLIIELQREAEPIKKYLRVRIPEIQSLALNAGDILRKILQ
jgi:polysaccharide pyruvyl transferase WcaK-like protein